MRKRILATICVASFLAAGSVLAGGGLWTGNGTAPYLWDDPLNWETGVPAAGDTVYITAAGTGTTKYPIIQDGIAAQAGTIILGWDNFTPNPGDMTKLIMTGGSLTTTSDMWIGKDDGNDGNEGPGIFEISGGTVALGPTGHLIVGQGSAGTVNQTGGMVSPWRLVLDWDSNSPGTYNLHGGIVHITDAAAPIHLRPGSLLDIAGDGQLLMDSDQTAAILAGIDSGHITAFGGLGTVLYDYDVTNPGQTTVWAVPEPATLAMLAAAGLFLRRRRR